MVISKFNTIFENLQSATFGLGFFCIYCLNLLRIIP